MSEEEKKAIEYFKGKIKNKLPLYEETYVDGKPYRRNFLQLETNFTEEQANKTQILLNYIDRLQKELEQEKEKHKSTIYNFELTVDKLENSKDKIRQLLKQVNSSIGHFKATDSNNIMFRIKDRLEDLLKEN